MDNLDKHVMLKKLQTNYYIFTHSNLHNYINTIVNLF